MTFDQIIPLAEPNPVSIGVPHKTHLGYEFYLRGSAELPVLSFITESSRVCRAWRILHSYSLQHVPVT